MATIKLNKVVADSADIYAQGLVEACALHALAPLEVLTESDRYPKVTQIDEVEFIIGWFHGVAEACGVHVEVLWEQVAPAPMKNGNPKPKRKAKASKRQRLAAITSAVTGGPS